jgi:hypothetical protein
LAKLSSESKSEIAGNKGEKKAVMTYGDPELSGSKDGVV